MYDLMHLRMQSSSSCQSLLFFMTLFLVAASFTLFDGAAMAILKKNRGDYGLQRLYGNLGAIFLTPISGFLIDYYSDVNGEQDYRWEAQYYESWCHF